MVGTLWWMMWWLVGSAGAEELVFASFVLSANEGVTLDYLLSAATADRVDRSARMGGAPRISVQFASGGMDRTSHVELNAAGGRQVLAEGSWPPGLTATVRIAAGNGVYDRLRLPQGSGSSVQVRIDGGTAGARPLGAIAPAPSRAPPPQPAPQASFSGPVPQVDPMALLAAAQQAAQAAEQAARLAEQQRLIAEEQRRIAEERAAERARLQAIVDDPGHPLHAACAIGVQGGLLVDCIQVGAYRTEGPSEVAACMALDAVPDRIPCFESLEGRAYVATAAIDGCVAVFGGGNESLRCIQAVAESPRDPASDITACGDAFDGNEDRLRCVRRFWEAPGQAGSIAEACATSFAHAPHECLAIAGAAQAKMQPEDLAACGETFDDRWSLECLRAIRPLSGAAALVEACDTLFGEPKDTVLCLEAARRAPDPQRITACAEAPEKRRMRCVEGE